MEPVHGGAGHRAVVGLGDQAGLLPGACDDVGGVGGASSRHDGAGQGYRAVSCLDLQIQEHREAIYYDYFNSPDTMFAVPDRDGRLETKDVVLGVQLNDSYKAYPVAALQERRIVNDVVGGEGVLVLGSAASQGARAYYRGDRVFDLPADDNGGDLAELQP